MSVQLVSPTEVAAARLLLELAKDGDAEVDDAVMAIASAAPAFETTGQPAAGSTGPSSAAMGLPQGSPGVFAMLQAKRRGLPGPVIEPLHHRLKRLNAKIRSGGQEAETASNWPSVEVKAHSFDSSREIGDALRSDVAVLLDVSEVDAPEAGRLVDFAAGVAYALHGSVDRLSSARLLLLPLGLAEKGTMLSVEDDAHPLPPHAHPLSPDDFDDEFPEARQPSARRRLGNGHQ